MSSGGDAPPRWAPIAAARRSTTRLALTMSLAGIVSISALAGPGGDRPATRSQAREAPSDLQQADRPDLAIRAVDRSGVTGDWQNLTISGTLEVEVANVGGADASAALRLVAFEDVDGDERASETRDRWLGITELPRLPAGRAITTTIAVSGSVLFRDHLIHVHADVGDRISEHAEDNNVGHTGEACERPPQPGTFRPTLEWEWRRGRTDPASDQVMTMPVVIDLNGDALPEIVFGSYAVNPDDDGRLRAVHGDGSGEWFTVDNVALDIRASSPLAAGDIDADGRPEIIAVAESGGELLAFEHDGSFKWRSDSVANGIHRGGAAIADLDQDGTPEVIVGATAFDNRGRRLWTGTGGRGENRAGYGPLSLAIDLHPAAGTEVVAGNTLYRADGGLLWRAAGVPDGYNAVGNFDDDPEAEIVLVARRRLYLLEHDGTRIWGGRPIPGSVETTDGGPPTVADVDGDGQPEIGVASGDAYTVFETDGTVRWSAPTQDLSSRVTGSSVFDFEGDGRAEVVYSDEQMLRIYRGTDGAVLWETESPSGTTHELPVIADVDADGSAEIVMISNDWRRTEVFEPTGVQIYGDLDGGWVPTRGLWNQHTYHVDIVNDDGTIPAVETPSWTTHNTFRRNLSPDGRLAVADLTASRLVVRDDGGPGWTIAARIGNGGARPVTAGANIAFYVDGVLLGTTRTTVPLAPGEYADVAIPWSNPDPGAHEIRVGADDDGTGDGALEECDETNNVHRRSVTIGTTPSPTPIPTSTPTPTATSSPSVTPSHTPTSTSTASATALPSSTPVPSATATATASPSPTDTPSHHWIFLPMTLAERCPPSDLYTDVVVVLDASRSMLALAPDGRRKLDVAVDAIVRFADHLRLTPDGDRIGIVAFNSDARRLAAPTEDRAVLLAALAAITVRSGTRIDRGIDAAALTLRLRDDAVGRLAAMIVLTDGHATGVSGDVVQRSADRARALGTTIYAIGVGAAVDMVTIRGIAGDAGRTFGAPDPRQIANIFDDLRYHVPCPPSIYWGRRQ